MTISSKEQTQLATLAGGCFWCLEAVFQELIGVQQVIPGYCGGSLPNPTYELVCTGNTGHAEAVQITFAPEQISYQNLLEVFFSIHDPTTLNRQGNDIGTQYRSVIFYHDEAQHKTALRFVRALEEEGQFSSPIVTQIEPITNFYPAEAYHHNYFRNNPGQGYCRLVISPKLNKFRKKFSPLLINHLD